MITEDIDPKIRDAITYPMPIINTPLKNNVQLLYADYIASGRPSPIIEKHIQDNIYPFYSNTHSNAYCGLHMKNEIKNTKQYLRTALNMTSSQKIIFTGNGTTSATNHLIALLNISNMPTINLFLTIYEHHSNYLPWIAIQKKNKHVNIHVIPITKTYDIDIVWLCNKLNQLQNDCLNIVSITACSNVTGIMFDIKKIASCINKYNTGKCKWLYKQNLLFVDYACSAPYIVIDSSICDALFFSPHKFIGGVSTPGVLIVNKNLFLNDTPYEPGGGCVKKVCSKEIIYQDDIEKKESAGTPNIVGIIKLKKVFQLKKIFQSYITTKEHEIAKYVFGKLSQLTKKYNNLQMLLNDVDVDNRLPIVCISVKNVHYNFIVVLLNDLFGIQTRGGVSCTGLFAELIEKLYDIKGWCRISFSWLMNKKEIEFILEAIEYVVGNYGEYMDKYDYDKNSNLFVCKLK